MYIMYIYFIVIYYVVVIFLYTFLRDARANPLFLINNNNYFFINEYNNS